MESHCKDTELALADFINLLFPVYSYYFTLGAWVFLPYPNSWIGGSEIHGTYILMGQVDIVKICMRKTACECLTSHPVFIHLQGLRSDDGTIVRELQTAILILMVGLTSVETFRAPESTDIACLSPRYLEDRTLVVLYLLLDIRHDNQAIVIDITPFLIGKRCSMPSHQAVIQVSYHLLHLVSLQVFSDLSKAVT